MQEVDPEQVADGVAAGAVLDGQGAGDGVHDMSGPERMSIQHRQQHRIRRDLGQGAVHPVPGGGGGQTLGGEGDMRTICR
ncbi:hypothetical protein FDO65_04540 [Nakamurella flava]|uniref:Uncharacterized protein n=1 Tax=Nakamurella flava TaxID=2576308 RepID=A0A4U6QKR7_9ACTN|nr:hypothetical protein [Nakamurella flava]TKV60931.1 hypothetical protein FDO65_04540 [Nakamurella flava]